MLKRIVLFLITNLAVLLTLSITMRLLGIESLLNETFGLDLRALLIYAAVIGFSGSFISLAISKWSAIWMTGAHVIQRPRDQTEAWLVETVRRLARQAGIGMPDVAIYDAPDPNAFATGMFRNHALVAVSTGLLYHMRADEVEAVLGHEISHIANSDMLTLALVQGVVNTF
ncbi:MAG: protease HtpX, partial [Gammaproteobacteria bacterium]